MDYIHNAVHRFMIDNGIKPNELFQIIPEKPTAVVSIGFFDENKEFHTTDTIHNHKEKDKEASLLIDILQEKLQIEPIGRYMPSNNDIYYSVVSSNKGNPSLLKVQSNTWTDSIEDLSLYAIRNCFRSENDANLAIKNNFYGNLLNRVSLFHTFVGS